MHFKLNELYIPALDCLMDGMGSRTFMHIQKSIAKNINWPNMLAFKKSGFSYCVCRTDMVV